LKKPDTYGIYGLMAEFDAPEDLLAAARTASKKGYRHMDAYTPFPMEELTDALSIRHSTLSLFVLCCAIAGGVIGFGMQYFTSVIDYPLNIGGKPLNSWPQFIPITFEMTILFAAIGAVVGMIFRNGLPRPVHPVFNVDRFELASRDKFFLCIEATDPFFDRRETEQFLKSLKPSHVTVVDN
jgi:Protein of unknown function (DUF3341)